MRGLGIIVGLWVGCLTIGGATVIAYHIVRAARVFP